MRLLVIRTLQPHWSAHSGINQFLSRLPAEGIEVDQIIVNRCVKNRVLRRIEMYVRPWFCWRASHVYNLFDFFAEMRALWRILFYSTDHVHFLDGEHSLQFLPYLRGCLGKRGRSVGISAMFHQPVEILKKMVSPKTVSLLDKIIVLSPCQKLYFNTFVPFEKIIEIPHGVDCDYFHPLGHQPRGKKKFVCLAVGYWLRDYDMVAKIAKSLEKRTDIEFHIVSKKAEHLGVLSNTKIFWGIEDAELLRMYQDADLCLLPLTDATANNVLLEAIACGVPIITTDIPGTRAYFDEKFCHFIASSDEVEGTNHVIQRLVDNPSELLELSARSRECALKYSWTNFAHKFKEAIVDVG